MLRFGYFDSDIIGVDDEGMPIFDRAETSDLFALLFANMVSDGVLALPSNCFMVRAAGEGLNIEIDPGFGMVKGHFCYNDEVDRMTIETPPQKYSRIDRVVMRCNFLDRMVEIIIKTGEEAATPVPPELIRPAAGDYFELCLANIKLTKGQKLLTQSSISDTRPNSSVCGYITQLIDHLDTAVFFEQLDAFYEEFVRKSDLSYEEFVRKLADAYRSFTNDITAYINTLKQDSADAYDNFLSAMNNFYLTLSQQGQDLHDQYSAELTGYLAELETKGNSDLAAITQQLLDFRNANEKDFLEWLDRIKGMLGEDDTGKLLILIDQLSAQLEDTQAMLFTGMLRTKLVTDQGDHLIDSTTGKPLLVGRPICSCNINQKQEGTNNE